LSCFFVANVDFDHYFVQTGLLKVCFIILATYAKLKNIKKKPHFTLSIKEKTWRKFSIL